LRIRDENGGILPLTAGFILVAVLILIAVVDFGRYTVTKEKLQTAGDSASLAGAKSVERMVQLEIKRGDKLDECCGLFDCWPCCLTCPGGDTVIVTGRESYLLESEGWKSYCCSCGCDGMKILDRWVNYTNGGNDAINAARSFFEINKPPEMEPTKGGNVTISIDTTYLSETRKGSPLYPSIIIKTEGKIKTLMMGIFSTITPTADTKEMKIKTCSQGRSYYRDTITGKWRHPPNNNCQE